MRVLAVTNLWPTGDSHRGIFVEQQVKAIRALGHEVDVEIVAQARGRLDYVAAIPRVRARASAGRYDILHVHFGMTALAARFAGRTPRVLSLYGSDVNDAWKRAVTRLGWAGTAARIYVSERLAASAGDSAGVIIPNGVDFGVFQPGDRVAARRELGIADDQRVILFGGQPDRAVKGYDTFRAVLGELRKRAIDVQELILTERGQPLRRVVAKYDAADLLLFTSKRGSEGSPTVVKEAAVMGLPVVSVDVGDVAAVLDGVTPSKVLAYPDSAEPGGRERLIAGLADASAAILGAPRRADGRERRAALDLPATAQRVVEVYQMVASG